MSSKREFVESPQEQGTQETKPWVFTVPTSWGTVTGITSVLVETINTNGTYTDTSATNLTGGNTLLGQVITTKSTTGLTANQDYRLGIKFACGSTVHEVYLIIKCKK